MKNKGHILENYFYYKLYIVIIVFAFDLLENYVTYLYFKCIVLLNKMYFYRMFNIKL